MPTKSLHIEPSLKRESPKFDMDKLYQYKLSCEISDTSFYCEVTNLIDNEVVASESYQFPSIESDVPITQYLQNIYETHDFLKSLKWKLVEIVIDNQDFTLIPLDLFRKEYTVRYLQLAKGTMILPDDKVNTFTHEALEIINVFGCNIELYNWFSETYPLIETLYKHKTSQLIDFAVSSSKAQSAFLYFGNHYFLMIITANGALKYCNRFYYKTPQDLVYYILFTMNELEIEPDEIFLRLYGNIKEQTEDYDLLNQYLPNVKIGI